MDRPQLSGGSFCRVYMTGVTTIDWPSVPERARPGIGRRVSEFVPGTCALHPTHATNRRSRFTVRKLIYPYVEGRPFSSLDRRWACWRRCVCDAGTRERRDRQCCLAAYRRHRHLCDRISVL